MGITLPKVCIGVNCHKGDRLPVGICGFAVILLIEELVCLTDEFLRPLNVSF